jgi:hypothetical protein
MADELFPTWPSSLPRNDLSRPKTFFYGLIIVAFLLVDFVPRFFQGDSVSYLTTGHNGWIPPDRSWSFGFAVNYLLRHSHGYSAFIFIQTILLGGIIGATRLFFRDFRSWQTLYAITAAAICLDPIVEIYTRFFMTDFASFACFMIFLLGLHSIVTRGSAIRTQAIGLLLALAAGVAAVFLRVAYALIMELTVLLIAVMWCLRLSVRQWIELALTAAIPFVAVGLLLAANSLVFAQRFHGEVFVTKLSGVFLAGVFAPALKIADFRHAGIAVTPAEFQSLKLDDYDKRVTQVWGQSPDDLQHFLREKLNVHDDYTAKVDHAASALVKSAFLRDPLSLAIVYARTAKQYVQPAQWHRMVYFEMGLPRPLPDDFVSMFNSYSVPKITTDITKVRSLLIRLYDFVSYAYPVQLGLGICAALLLLVRERRRPCVVVLSAGLLADLAAAPLYSNYLIARYVLAAIVISYLLIGLAVLSLIRPRDQSDRRLAAGIAR